MTVTWSANPSSFYYHHPLGPYWDRQQAANADAKADQAPSFTSMTCSKFNTGVRDVETGGMGNVCGHRLPRPTITAPSTCGRPTRGNTQPHEGQRDYGG